MSLSKLLRIGVLVLLVSLRSARGEIKTIVEHNDNTKATAQFKFNQVPPPSKNDAASRGKWSVVDGTPDPNSGGDTAKLSDGRVPTESDQPDENFFFDEGTDGGRLLLDLSAAIAIKQVNVYSWHPNTRGPQVFKLYASDGMEPGLDKSPKKAIDPEKAGWKLIAAIDTRPKKADGTVNDDDDAMGGQYGVSIFDSGGAIGKYRYLLVVASRTEGRDDWGNTFFSELDVVEDGAPAK